MALEEGALGAAIVRRRRGGPSGSDSAPRSAQRRGRGRTSASCPTVIIRGRYEGFFFFQAEDGIRDYKVTGVQTCALPIFTQPRRDDALGVAGDGALVVRLGVDDREERVLQLAVVAFHREVVLMMNQRRRQQIGRASCRERV